MDMTRLCGCKWVEGKINTDGSAYVRVLAVGYV